MIAAAAVKIADKVWTLPPPARHHNVLWLMNGLDPFNPKEAERKEVVLPFGKPIQGFITDTGDFVERAAALELAKACGQLKSAPIAPPQLYSEDLW